MKNHALLILGCLATAASSLAAAADPPRYAFECDTPPGHYSYWHRTVTGSEISITGQVTVNELGTDKKWIPVVNVMLSNEKDEHSYGIHISAIAKTPDLLILRLRKVDGSDAIGLGFMPRTKDPIPFMLRLDASGALTASVGGVEAATALGAFKPSMLELSCSTGDFEFTAVRVEEKP